jgi:tRNA1(Val) A37 N6-methylase TrmN6
MKDRDEIYVLNRRVRLYQPVGGFRTSMDSVLLAAACPAQAGDRVLDLGCGVGGAGLCVMARVPDIFLTGIELQADHAALAGENAVLNAVQDRAAFIAGDIRDDRAGERFDHVICNPPYLEAGTHTPSPDAARAIANGHVDEGDIKDWIDAAFDQLFSGGTLTMIHRADMVDKIIRAMGKRFGAVEIIPLWPHAGEAARRVIVRAIKDRRSPACIHPGIILHAPGGAYTDAANSVLRDMAPIP